jgi:hypothetical protein
MSKKSFSMAFGLVAVFSSLVACGGEGFGVDESLDAVTNEATGDLTKADGVVSVCPAGTMRVEWDVKKTDSAGRVKPLRISACVAKNAAGQPLAHATTPTAPRTTTASARTATEAGGGGGGALVCKDYGSIFCCWNSHHGVCVSSY